MATSTPEERLAALGPTPPAVPTPMANYVPYRVAGNLLFLSGQGPKRADGSFMVGRLGKAASVEQGYEGGGAPPLPPRAGAEARGRQFHGRASRQGRFRRARLRSGAAHGPAIARGRQGRGQRAFARRGGGQASRHGQCRAGF